MRAEAINGDLGKMQLKDLRINQLLIGLKLVVLDLEMNNNKKEK